MKTPIDPAFEPHPEDVARLRADLDVDPLAYVADFVERVRLTRHTAHDWRATFRAYVRRRASEATPQDIAPLDTEASAARARALLDALEKVPS